MKLKFSKDRTSGASTLVVQIDDTDWVDHMNAQWLGTHTAPALLRARYELEQDKTRIFYNTAGYVALPKYIREHTLGVEAYANFLASISQVLDIVGRRNITAQNILWSPRHTFVSETSGLPAFALVPSQVPVIPGKNSPQGLLRFLLRPKYVQNFLGMAQLQTLQSLTHKDQLEPALLRQTLLEVFGEPVSLSSTNSHHNGAPTPPTPSELPEPHNIPWQRTPKHAASGAAVSQTPSPSRPHSGTSATVKNLEILPSDSTVLAQSQAPQADAGPQIATLTITRMSDRHRVQLTASSVSIGRSKLADVHAGSNTDISRVHAFLTVEKDQIFLTDNRSTNGTWTDHTTLRAGERTCLGQGAAFWLGGEVFHVSMETHPNERT